ncbi:hypothetical protein [Photorhabdus sp. MH8.4]
MLSGKSYIPYGFQDGSRRQGSECSQQRGNLKDNGYIPYGFQDASRRQGSESPGA